jgi:regulator of PEP synthase PpsR (kinase-PPPase family)
MAALGITLEDAMYHILIVSDGTGGTAQRALQAALTQFGETEVSIEVRSEVRTEEQVAGAVKEAAHLGAFIVHTIVSRDLRNALADLGRLHNVPTIDLMGPLLAQLAQQLSYTPSEKPGLFRELNKEYFQRIEAVEFALRHDDGQRTHELAEAELVLLGVSRTFKTPLSIYLAFMGWLVGNIPIILDAPLPTIVQELPPSKVFGLMTDAESLTGLRRVRHKHLGGVTGDYADFKFVQRELAYARLLFRSHPSWPVIQVTNKPIEEIASEILAIVRSRRAVRNE